jgi:hypothetical protein
MSPPFHDLLQYATWGISCILGWFMRELWAAVQKLKEDIASMREEIPKSYVAKDDYKADIGRVHELLDKIYDKLEGKADR